MEAQPTPTPAPGGDGGQQPAPEAWSAPDFLPDVLRGTSADDTRAKIEAMAAEAARVPGLREQLSKVPQPPKDWKDYDYKPSEQLAGYFSGGEEDAKILDLAKQAFHKNGVPAANFGQIIEDFYGPMVQTGMLPAPYSAKTEVENFGKWGGLSQEDVGKTVPELELFSQALLAKAGMKDEAAKDAVAGTLAALTSTAGGMLLLRTVRDLAPDVGIRVAGGGLGNGALTQSDVDRLTSDPRIDPGSDKYDAELRKRYDAFFQQKFTK